MKGHIDDGERQMAIRNEETGFIPFRLEDFSREMIGDAMALGRY